MSNSRNYSILHFICPTILFWISHQLHVKTAQIKCMTKVTIPLMKLRGFKGVFSNSWVLQDPAYKPYVQAQHSLTAKWIMPSYIRYCKAKTVFCLFSVPLSRVQMCLLNTFNSLLCSFQPQNRTACPQIVRRRKGNRVIFLGTLFVYVVSYEFSRATAF